MSKKLKVGEILSETAFYVVKNVATNGNVEVLDDNGNQITLGKGYVDSDILMSAEQFTSTEEKTATELAELFLNSPRIAMTVEYMKKDTPKTKTAFKKEVLAWTENVKNEFMSNGISALEKYATQPVLPYTPGQARVMRGRHYGGADDFGRVAFIDMEEERGTNPAHDGRIRQVDPRTLMSITVAGVKYTKKK